MDHQCEKFTKGGTYKNDSSMIQKILFDNNSQSFAGKGSIFFDNILVLGHISRGFWLNAR